MAMGKTVRERCGANDNG